MRSPKWVFSISVGNSESHENQGFEVFGKVEQGKHIAKSIRKICLVSVEVLRSRKIQKNEAADNLQ